jgi:predicted AAA+ superfamily ATPase
VPNVGLTLKLIIDNQLTKNIIATGSSSLELANRQTVESYVNLLEQSFVIYRLPPLTRNTRKEISRLKKIYFFDNGIRNSLINRFDDLSMREDAGVLWESEEGLRD